jgi:hypothetical protein
MKAGGVDYLVRQSEENPMGFLSLLGRVMPRESHIEMTAEVRIRQEVRRDLVEKLVILMKAPDSTKERSDKPERALPAITHTPDTMLKATVLQDREGLSRRAENARREGANVLTGVVQRAAAMQIENASELPGQDAGKDDTGTPIRNSGPPQRDVRGVPGRPGGVAPRGAPYVRPPGAQHALHPDGAPGNVTYGTGAARDSSGES